MLFAPEGILRLRFWQFFKKWRKTAPVASKEGE